MYRKVFFIGVITFFLLFFNSCNKKSYVDPLWNINLNWNKEKILSELSKWSKSGDITNCVFSFEKTSFIKTGDFDAKITNSLNTPQFNKNTLQKISYSLMVSFKNENTAQFNPNFYEYFKDIMKVNYGNSFNEKYNDNEISLQWILNDNKTVKVKIMKTINYYSVVIDV